MKRFLLQTLLILFSLTPLVNLAQGPYPPAAGETGSTAVSKDDIKFNGWATGWANLVYGYNVDDDWKTPEKSLGRATGNAYDVVYLGDGGQITMTFDNPIVDGDGPDFAVFGNSMTDFDLDLAWVEVSADGINYYRFPNHSITPGNVNPNDPVYTTNISGYAGKYRTGFGVPFDLKEIGLVYANYIRIVDITGDGKAKDSDGNVIWDPFSENSNAGFGLEAIGVLNSPPFTQYSKQILFINEGNTSTLNGYNPQTMSSTLIKNLKSINTYSDVFDFLVDGKYAYIATNKGVKKIDTEIKTENFLDIDLGGSGKLAIYKNQLLVSTPMAYLQSFNKNDLTENYSISQFEYAQCGDIAVVGDFAYIATSSFKIIPRDKGENGNTVKLIVVDLINKGMIKEITLPEDISNITQLLVKGTKIYGIVPMTFDWNLNQSVPGKLVIFDTQTELIDVINDMNFGVQELYGNIFPANSIIIDNTLYAVMKNNLATIDLNTGQILNPMFVPDDNTEDELYIRSFAYDSYSRLLYVTLSSPWAGAYGQIFNLDGTRADPAKFPGMESNVRYMETDYRKDYHPFAVNPLPDKVIPLNSPRITISTSNEFIDIDNPGGLISKSARSSSLLVNTSTDGNNLYLDLRPGMIGKAIITVTATSNGKTGIDEFEVEIKADQPPIVAYPIADVNMRSTSTIKAIPINNVFSDPDNPANAITKAVNSNDNPSLVNAYVEEEILYLIVSSGKSGIANITVRATSNGKTVDDQFVLTVTQNLMPKVINPIPDQEARENNPTIKIDLVNVFTDPDDDVNQIVKSILSNSNPQIVDATIDGNLLTLNVLKDKSGEAILTIRATSAGQTVDDEFKINIISDQPPVIAFPAPDIIARLYLDDRFVDLKNEFSDPDDNKEVISKSILNNTNPGMVAVILSNDSLFIHFNSKTPGEAKVTIRGTSRGKSADDEFTIKIIGDLPPVVINPIPDIKGKEFGNLNPVDLKNRFIDPDDPDMNISLEVLSNTNTTLVEALLFDKGADRTLQLQMGKGTGDAIITIRATSNDKIVDDEFSVTVIPDQAPYVQNPVKDINMSEGSERYVQFYSTFADPDDPVWNIQMTLQSNSNEKLLMATMEWQQVRLTALKGLTGSATITVRGTCNDKFVETSFKVNVNKDTPPVVANPMRDTTVKENNYVYIPLQNVFFDKDEDYIQVKLSYHSNEKLCKVYAWDQGISVELTRDMLGQDTIVLEATANNKSVFDSFVLHVISDLPPYVKNPIPDIKSKVNSPQISVDVSNVFADDDDSIQFIYSYVDSISNPKLLNAWVDSKDINTKNLIIELNRNASGTATLRLRAYSGAKFATLLVNVIVDPDKPPYVSNPIKDQKVKINARDLTIDLSKNFADPDDPSENFEFKVKNLTPENFTVNVDKQKIILAFAKDKLGTGDIIVFANSNGRMVSDTFKITIVDDIPPFVANDISNVNARENSDDIIIDLTNVFGDKDDDLKDIVKSIASNSNKDLITAVVDGNRLILGFTKSLTGDAFVSIRGTSYGKSVDAPFIVKVIGDKPPVIANALGDVFARENSADKIIDVQYLFSDPDDDSTKIVKSIVGNTNNSIVTASVVSNSIVLKFAKDKFGETEITVQGLSFKKWAEDKFKVTVIQDKPPVVVSSIQDMIVRENADNQTINIADVFMDFDDDMKKITKTVFSNSNEQLLTTTISENALILKFIRKKFGKASVILQALSNGKTVNDTFNVTVLEDMAPKVVFPVQDISVRESSPDKIVNLTSVFADPDDKDVQIIKTLLSNSADTLVNASITGDTLNLTFTEKKFGETKIVIRATSKEKYVDEEFLVKVIKDQPPIVKHPVDNIIVRENSPVKYLNISKVFDDVDDDITKIIKSIAKNSNSDLVKTFLKNDTIQLNFMDKMSGEASIIVQALSNRKIITDIFNVIVMPDLAPIVENKIKDLTVRESAPPQMVDLRFVFSDPDDPINNIGKSLIGNSNETLVSSVLNENELNLSFATGQSGEAKITIQSKSNNLTVNEEFKVIVLADKFPVVYQPIADIAVKENSGSMVIKLDSVFTDPDDPMDEISKSISGISNPDLLKVTILQNYMTLEFAKNKFGEAFITVTALSNGKTVTDQFKVVVNFDQPPFVENLLKDVIASHKSKDVLIDLSKVFNDMDDDPAKIEKTLIANTNETIVNTTLDKDNFYLKFIPGNFGKTTLKIRGNSNGKTVDDEFSLIVVAGDTLVLARKIGNIKVRENSIPQTVDLKDVFTVIGSEDATIGATLVDNSNTTIATANINGTVLKIEFKENKTGTFKLKIRGSYLQQSIDEEFTVEIIPDLPPVVLKKIDDVKVLKNAADINIDLTGTFNDPDDDASKIIKSIASNSNESLLSASIEGNMLKLSFANDQIGNAVIIIRAESNKKTVDLNFNVIVEKPVGIDDNDILSNLKVYPNPFTDRIFISLDKESKITIIDITGKILLEKNNCKSLVKLDLGNFKHGIYLVKIESEIKTVVRKIVKK